MTTNPMKKQPRESTLREKAARAAGGAGRLVEWWGVGRIVAQATADARAEVCARCPLNVPEKLFEKLTGAAAKLFRQAIAWKTKAGLRVPLEKQLRVCEACGCDLKLKVWSPIEVARQGDLSGLDPKCWILKET